MEIYKHIYLIMREDKRKKGKTIIVNLNYSQAGFHEINHKCITIVYFTSEVATGKAQSP